MAEPGFLYVVINPSLEGMVSLGCMADEPAESITVFPCDIGAEPPFIVAYKRYFVDVNRAERSVRADLERRGYSPPSNSEFFWANLERVVEAIFSAQRSQGRGSEDIRAASAPVASHEPDEFLDSLVIQDSPDWESVLEEAEAKYYGLGDELEDHEEAFKLFKRAAQLGAAKAYRMLGVMHRDGEGCAPSKSKALEYLKEGARRGDTCCYPEMAKIFVDVGQMDNARKCWSRYFASPLGDEAGLNCYLYFRSCSKHGWPIDHSDKLRRHLADLRRMAEGFTLNARKMNNMEYMSSCEQVEREIEVLFGR